MQKVFSKLKLIALGLFLGAALAFPLGLNLGRGEPLLSNPLAQSQIQEHVAEQVKKQTHVECVKSLDGELLFNEALIKLGSKVKAVLIENKSTLLVFKEPEEFEIWKTCTKQQLKNY